MAQAVLEATIPDELAGLRLDQALARLFPEYSRSRLKAWILAGAVWVDGEILRPKDSVAGGESVTVEPAADAAESSRPEPVDLEIALENEAFLVLNKPAGLVVHPGAGNLGGTLMNGLLYRYPELRELPRAGIVHRLDKDTSGLLLVARTLTAHTNLVRQLAERQVSREYEAVCAGVLTGGGRVDAPVGRHPVDRLRMAVREDGKEAVTHYRVLQRFRAHTHVQARLETGRTHQIRVHFAWLRHPLVGDPVYGGRMALPAGASDELALVLREFRRQALCACRLAFAHPVSGAPVEVETVVPDDFRRLLDALARDAVGAGS
ncbi:MAG: 23S rRNA pseudouridine(1911/1915/1917) synthase RluD [Gammaproteobacteria bacterium]|nr:23S rRNA pseudouridine(1911/1915/1917) synthase RluD [Gammaproteobacteria bacterium]MDH4254928.1 23S rRNA pseudouridine(1911/1915/1917) synthase RluD [Gammaproteobacteria bacterium]